jgi:hypothetical protein
VQTVSESKLLFLFFRYISSYRFTLAMGVLRMIKLFGWEAKINQQVEEKREEELRLVWKRKILDMINNNIK